MKEAVLEVRYACGLELTDHVMVQTSSRLILSPQLNALLGILQKTERRTTIRVNLDGVTYRVECNPEGEYVVGARLSFGERWLSELQLFKTPTVCQRRLNGRFAHLLSAWALIGACYIAHSVKAWDARAVSEAVLLCFASVTLYVVGHMCFSEDDRSSK